MSIPESNSTSNPVWGKMKVLTSHGRYGQFNYAYLYSAIGDFSVRYNGLDEFEPGEYQGVFFIDKIYTNTRKFGVGIIVEPVAIIEDIKFIESGDEDDINVPEAIVDPIEEEITVETKDEPLVDSPEIKQPIQTTSISNDTELKQLFGELLPLEEIVKLDPTVGRALFRNQRDYLKEHGYSFITQDQSWVKKH